MKIIDQKDLRNTVDELKAAGKKIVFTNGCFDVLHAGHVRYLAEAKELGNVLIVGINSDASVSGLKGPGRPVNVEEDRAEVIAALGAVDFVVLFEELTAEALVEQIRPHVYVKGGDYNVKDLPEAKIAAQFGGKTILIPEVPGRSTTNIIRRIQCK